MCKKNCSFTELNVQHPNRTPAFAPNARAKPASLGYKNPFPPGTKPTFEAAIDAGYCRALANTELVRSVGGRYTCWVVTRLSRNSKYAKIKIQGKSVQCHRLAWLYHHPGEAPKGQISHLCHNPRCMNPQHLVDESPKDNCARKGCLGYLWDGDEYAPVCKHDPKCCKVTDISATVAELAREDAENSKDEAD